MGIHPPHLLRYEPDCLHLRAPSIHQSYSRRCGRQHFSNSPPLNSRNDPTSRPQLDSTIALHLRRFPLFLHSTVLHSACRVLTTHGRASPLPILLSTGV